MFQSQIRSARCIYRCFGTPNSNTGCVGAATIAFHGAVADNVVLVMSTFSWEEVRKETENLNL